MRTDQAGHAEIEMKASLMRPVMLLAEPTCEARIISDRKRVVFAEAEVTDESGRLVAKANSTFLVRTRTSGEDEASGHYR
ncbi:MAG: PaaI family thioesterase [Actinobacteria bacterium]|nr:PaaI family thioesterase [Actinomycetota bacterium]MCL5447386.1 PaaI family thioesterase [Actinomycetota bacterium]